MPERADDNTYITGTGQELRNVHFENDQCRAFGCAIHNPTDPHREWPTHWTGSNFGLVRLDPETGELHFDQDEMNYRKRYLVRNGSQPDVLLGPWVYCKSHVGPHETGWCSVAIRNKIKLDIPDGSSVEEAMQVVWDLGLPIYGYCDDCHEWIANEVDHECEGTPDE